MNGGSPQSSIRPVALGSTLQTSTYGQTIPVIYGRAKSAMYLIWAANLRKGSSAKSAKKILSFGIKKGQQGYIQNVDFLLGHNPIVSPLQFWGNQNARYPLSFAKQSGSGTVSDPDFYCILGVTYTLPYSVTFNDYGGQGPRSYSGNWETPMWNLAFQGPNPTYGYADRYTPQMTCYIWQPGSGPSIVLPLVGGAFADYSRVNIYYAKLDSSGSESYSKKNAGTAVPASALRLTFEPVLGDGPEFSGFSGQQILYPHYAGLGSSDLDLGSGTAIPDIRPEVLGTYPLYPTGDADFADMIEDIFSMGRAPAGFGDVNYTSIQHGLNCSNLPGFIQKFTATDVEAFNWELNFYRPNTAGNILIGATNTGVSGGVGAIVDAAGNAWTPVIPGSPGTGQMWWAVALDSPAGNGVTITGVDYNWCSTIAEIAGVDTFDDSAVASAGSYSVSITTTGAKGTPTMLVVFVNYAVGAGVTLPAAFGLWDIQWVPGISTHFYLATRVVYVPGTYRFTAVGSSPPAQLAIAAFKCSQPPAYPRALNTILEPTTLDLCRLQCRAAGLWGSLVMDSQQKASDWLEDLYRAMNAAPVWSGFQLKSIPYSEVSAAGNGAIYTSPTAAGPVANLTEQDFIAGDGSTLVIVERKAQVDVPNILQIQHPNRASDYNDITVSQPETAAIALYGPRKDSPRQMRMIQDPAVSRAILGIDVRRQNYLRNTYKFKLQAKWKLLEPMDLVTITDSQIGINALPVRLTSIAEDAEWNLDCEAEPFIYGVSAPQADIPITVPQPYQPQTGGSPGQVNAPIIFEPVVRLYGATNQTELWLAVSCAAGQILAAAVGASGGSGYTVGDVLTVVQSGAALGHVTVATVSAGVVTGVTISQAGRNYSAATNLAVTGGTGTGAQITVSSVSANYGGCQVFISTDGGASYNSVGAINGNATTGISTGDWPPASSPDTTNDLPLDLTESNGSLASYQTADEDNFVYPCYIAGGAGGIDYEIMTYAVATLTGANLYTLKATGGGHHLNRGVFGAPTLGAGVDHPSGSRFAFLGPVGDGTQPGVLKLQMDPLWVGKTLHFKFLAFNTFVGAVESLSDAVDYTYTVLGTVGNVNPAGAAGQFFQLNGV